MKDIRLIPLMFLLIFISCTINEDARDTTNHTNTYSLCQLAQSSDLLMGAALNVAVLAYENSSQINQYTNLFIQHYNMGVAEWEMKMEAIAAESNSMNYTYADHLLKFAEDNSITMRGHTLLWHGSTPDWIINSGMTTNEIEYWASNYIIDVVTYFRTNYPGVVRYWDVVNEAICNSETDCSNSYGLRETYWYRMLGEDYLEKSFKWARLADPDVKLFLNDYGISQSGWKQQKFLVVVSNLITRNVPIDGVGLQCHYSLDYFDIVSITNDIANIIDQYINMGMEVHITEFDVRINDDTMGITDSKLQKQADIYGGMLQLCVARSNVTAFLTWGFTDAHSWLGTDINYSWLDQSEDWPLPFDRIYQPKPAFNVMVNVLTNGV